MPNSIKRLLIARSQRGDTIVEVMVVLAVLSLSIGISYSTAHRSLLNARQAQESTAAAGYVQMQLEQLRVLAGNPAPSPANDVYSQTIPFCIIGSVIHANPGDCSMDTVGYRLSVYNCNHPGFGPCSGVTGPDAFVIQAVWPDVLGQGDDSSTLNYRISKP